MTTAALTRASRQQLLPTSPKVVMAPLEWPAAPILVRIHQARQRSVRCGRGIEHLVDDEAHVAGVQFSMSPPSGPPGVSSAPEPEQGGGHHIARRRHVVRSCSVILRGASKAVGENDEWVWAVVGGRDRAGGPPAGYQMVVTRVREGLSGIPSHAGVEREASTKVIVVVATDVEPAAPAVGEAPTSGSPMMASRMPRATAPGDTNRRIAAIRSLPPPEREDIVSQGPGPSSGAGEYPDQGLDLRGFDGPFLRTSLC